MKKRMTNNIIILLIGIVIIAMPYLLIPSFGNNIYYYIIWPLILIILSIVTFLVFPKKTQISKMKRSYIRQFAVIISLIYIIAYYSSGLLIGYSNSPMSHTLEGIAKNFWIIITLGILIEVVRSNMLSSVKTNKKIYIYIIVTIILILIDINLYTLNFADIFSGFGSFMKFTTKFLVPSIAINSFLSYLVYRDGLISALIFKMPFLLASIFTPIFPANNYSILCIIQLAIILLAFIKIEQNYAKKEFYDIVNKVTPWDYIRRIIYLIIIGIILMFTTGFLPYFPIIIASDSMKPVIKRGDVIIVEKTSFYNVKINDIISYDLHGISITHRVINIKETYTDGMVLVMKGDNNRSADNKYVTKKQFIGSVVGIIPKIGYIKLLPSEIFNTKEVSVGVEKGE